MKDRFEPGQTFEVTYPKCPFAELVGPSGRVAKSFAGLRHDLSAERQRAVPQSGTSGPVSAERLVSTMRGDPFTGWS